MVVIVMVIVMMVGHVPRIGEMSGGCRGAPYGLQSAEFDPI
jgi:hypothetical protein